MDDQWQKLKTKKPKFQTPAWVKTISGLASIYSRQNHRDEIKIPDTKQSAPYEDNNTRWYNFLRKHGYSEEEIDAVKSRREKPLFG